MALQHPLQTSSEVTHQKRVDLIFDIVSKEYNQSLSLLRGLVSDVQGLFDGKWPNYEECQAGYHNFSHALDVTLALARMTAGWNLSQPERKFPGPLFEAGIAAALFHDTGYIKDKGDSEGRGGKYTFSHVERSISLATSYLSAQNWHKSLILTVERLILLTDFHDVQAKDIKFNEELETAMARIVATADLVAQMADVDYLSNIHDLYEEFSEAYDFVDVTSRGAKEIQVYGSAQEILDGTLAFYENYVLPRLEEFGRMDRYLNTFFSDGRNPYQENIAANISYHYVERHTQWQRLGEILEAQGLVTHEQIKKAVAEQAKQSQNKGKKLRIKMPAVSSQLSTWVADSFSNKRLGEILLSMKVIGQDELCQGLVSQALPASLLDRLSQREMHFLLQASVLLQNISQDPRVIHSIMHLAATFAECEAVLIRMIDVEADETVVILATEALENVVGQRLPLDKNLAGWCYHHRLSVYINDVTHDEETADKDIVTAIFKTRSVLMAPLLVRGECIGVFELINKADNNFTEHENDIITCLANIIGFALGNILHESNAA